MVPCFKPDQSNAWGLILDDKLWSKLLNLARGGRLLGVLLGPPCETWSSARFHRALDSDDYNGPRPLRMRRDLWGLAMRTFRELLQLDVGNCLLLRGIWLATATVLRSGSAILEHPALPLDESYPSIWRTGLLRLLLQDGYLFKRTTIAQWRYGAEGIKPTSLMYGHGDLPSALRMRALSSVQADDPSHRKRRTRRL